MNDDVRGSIPPRTMLWAFLCIVPCFLASAHDAPPGAHHGFVRYDLAQAADSLADRTSGQGDLVFKVFKTNRDLPREALNVLRNAHGGFGVDRRPGHGEIYFALPKAGVFRITADLSSIDSVPTDDRIMGFALHNTAVWHRDDRSFLTFPSVDSFGVYTTTLDGVLLHTLGTPPGQLFENPAIREYFNGKNVLVPTDVQVIGDRFYMTTGYSPLDFVLTARVDSTDPMSISWTPETAFGGKGTGPGQLDVGHGLTLEPGGDALRIADRKNAELDRFDLEGKYLSTMKLAPETRPCDTDFLDGLMVVACLAGPDPRGAPIYLVRDGEIVSTLKPRMELGLLRFNSIHNAVLVKRDGKLYIVAQAWNPGDFAVFEQVLPE